MGYDEITLSRLKEVELSILEKFHLFCVKNNLKYFLVFGSAIGAVRHKGFIPWDDDIDVGMMREDYEQFIRLFDQHGIDNLELMTPERDDGYTTGVTHLQMKNTTFISEFSKNMKCHQGICIDIFPFDKVSRDERIKCKQLRGSFVYRRLLFLLGSGEPIIQATGIKKIILAFGCRIIHVLLNVFRIKASKLYKKFKYYCTLAQYEDTEFVCEFGGSFSDEYIENAKDFYPIIETDFEHLKVMISKHVDKHLTVYFGNDYMKIPPIEKQVNHMPYLIDFDK